MYLGATLKRDTELSFHKFPRDVSLREKWIPSIKRKDFIPGEQHRVCSQHFHGAKARLIRRPYYTSIASSVQTEKASKNMFAI